MWRADVCNSISFERRWGWGGGEWGGLKKERRNKMSGALLFFSRSHGLSENVSMCCVWGRLRAEKENILPSKPHATDSFWSQINQLCVSDHVTLFFFVLCVIPNISCFNPPPPPSDILTRICARTHARTQHAHAHLRHTHIQTFHFLRVRSPGRGRAARFSATCSGRKTGRRVQGCPTCKARRVRGGNPELLAELHFRQKVKFDATFYFSHCHHVLSCLHLHGKNVGKKVLKINSRTNRYDVITTVGYIMLC